MAKILLVDDEKSIRESVRILLTNSKHNVQTAENAAQALELLLNDDFDILLTDIMMPGLSGIELLRKCSDLQNDMIVLIMTGYPSDKTLNESIHYGAFEYIQKPVTKRNLFNVIDQAIMMQNLRRSVHKNIQERSPSENQIVSILAGFLEFHDSYTHRHQNRVGNLAAEVARMLNFPEEKINQIRVAGFLHDIGKIHLPSDLLNRPGKLSPLEMQQVKAHPLDGYDILNKLGVSEEICSLVEMHHERMDGSGYPKGLTGRQISADAGILALVNCIDAMMYKRPYNFTLTQSQVIEKISEMSGEKFPREIADTCIVLLKSGYQASDVYPF